MKVNYRNIYVSHLGNILFNYSILGVSLLALVLMSSVVSLGFYLITFTLGMLLILVTLGTIFMMNADLVRWLIVDNSAIMADVVKICYKAFPYALAITLATSVASLIIQCCHKPSRSTARLVLSIVGTVLAVVFGIIYFVMGLNK